MILAFLYSESLTRLIRVFPAVSMPGICHRLTTRRKIFMTLKMQNAKKKMLIVLEVYRQTSFSKIE